MAFNHKHLIDITQYSADDIMLLLETAKNFKQVNERRVKKVPTLKGFTVVNMFNEPSTRTRSSFEIAEKRLSADSLNFGGSSTSTVKGESLVDTVETLCSYKIDLIVVRDKHAGVPRKIADVSGVSVIDAGDGKHQHPTQAMLDLYTIREHFGHLDGLKVAIVGDLLHSRVCGSLVPALKTMGAEVTLVGPPTFQVVDPAYYGVEQTSSLDEVIEEMDVVYMLRVQLERMGGAAIPSRREYNRLYGLDLTDPACQVHWHRFCALLLAAVRTEGSLLSAALSARAPLGPGADRHARAEHRRRAEAWALPPTEDELRKRAMESF